MFPSTDVTAVCSVGGGEGEEGEENAYFLIHCCIRAISPALDRDRHPQGGASIKTRVASLVSAAEMFLNGVDPWGHLSSSQQILFPGNCQREGTLQECLYNVTLLWDTVTGPIRYISCKNLVLGPRDMGSVSRLELVTMAPMQTKKKSKRPYAWAWLERNRDESWKEKSILRFSTSLLWACPGPDFHEVPPHPLGQSGFSVPANRLHCGWCRGRRHSPASLHQVFRGARESGWEAAEPGMTQQG